MKEHKTAFMSTVLRMCALSTVAALLSIALLATGFNTNVEEAASLRNLEIGLDEGFITSGHDLHPCMAVETEVFLRNVNPAPQFTFKNTFGEYAISNKITGQLLLKGFTQYAAIALNLPVRQRKSDIVFPFQYFW